MDIVTTQKVAKADDLADMLVGGIINEEVAIQNEEKSQSDAFKDKGEGVKKPKAPDGLPDQKSKFAKKDLEYPKLELMICKRGKLKPKEGVKTNGDEEVIAYLDGTEGCDPCLTLRLNDMKAGEYYVLYRPDFKDYHKVRRLNIVFYSEFHPKKKGEELKQWEREQEEKAKNPQKLNPSASATIQKGDQLVEVGNLEQSQPHLGEDSSKVSLNSDRKRALSNARKNPPPEYDPEMAIELERLEQSSFKPDFYEKMEVLNYDRYIEMEKYVYPEFVDAP